MDQFTRNYVEGFMAGIIARNPGEKEFHQAVREVLESVAPYIVGHPYLMDQKILERLHILQKRAMILHLRQIGRRRDDRGEILPFEFVSVARPGLIERVNRTVFLLQPSRHRPARGGRPAVSVKRYHAKADFILTNDGDLEDLRRKVYELYDIICKRIQKL